MLLDLLDKTLDLPKKSKVITQPYIDFLAHQYKLSHNGYHGIEHWLRVLINGRLIAAETGADLELLSTLRYFMTSCVWMRIEIFNMVTGLLTSSGKLPAIGCI